MDTDEVTSETQDDTPIEQVSSDEFKRTTSDQIVFSPAFVNPFIEDAKRIIAEAPELYGVNPTTQEVMEFKEKETAWRSKLKSL